MSAHNDSSSSPFSNLAIEDQLCLAVCRTARSITRLYAKKFEAHGLTHPQYLVLLTLYADHCLTAGEIARKICLDPSSVTPILKKMEADNLILRERPADNQRQLLVRLTAEGAALQPVLANVQSEVAHETGLNKSELDALCTQLQTIADRLDNAKSPDGITAEKDAQLLSEHQL